jgi:hypothetical protein
VKNLGAEERRVSLGSTLEPAALLGRVQEPLGDGRRALASQEVGDARGNVVVEQRRVPVTVRLRSGTLEVFETSAEAPGTIHP